MLIVADRFFVAELYVKAGKMNAAYFLHDLSGSAGSLPPILDVLHSAALNSEPFRTARTKPKRSPFRMRMVPG